MTLLKALLLSLLACTSVSAAQIRDYTPVFVPFSAGKAKMAAIRSFTRNGSPAWLAVDMDTLETTIVTGDLRGRESGGGRYYDLLARSWPGPTLRNRGIRHGSGAGYYLTADFCPSSRPMEARMFRELERLGTETGKPVPVALAMTGKWLEKHGSELEEILALERRGVLRITWVNHSDSHPYHPGEPDIRNFLLAPGIDLREEILRTERMMLEKGLVPSVFFRFPGLVGDDAALGILRRLSLVPVGSDAWLAKGEEPKPGSVILVHGNGNEPKGIDLLLEFLRRGKRELLSLEEAPLREERLADAGER